MGHLKWINSPEVEEYFPVVNHRKNIGYCWYWKDGTRTKKILPLASTKALGLIIFNYNPANIFSCLAALSDTICDAQPAETEQVAVSLKMTIIKVTMKMDLVILRF